MSALCENKYVHHVHGCELASHKKTWVESPGTAFKKGCKSLCGCWESTGPPEEEQPVLLTAGILLLPQELGYSHPGLKAASSLKHNHRPAKEKSGSPYTASAPTGGK